MIELDPSKIYEDFTQNLIDKSSAIEKLIVLIENSNNVQVRLNSIKFLEKVGEDFKKHATMREKVFTLFENLLISDSNEKIRNIAAKVLGEKFVEISINPLRWALLHEQSRLCLNTIFKFIIKLVIDLVQVNDRVAKFILLNELKQMVNNKFKIGFEQLIDKGHVNRIPNKELSLILINYFTLIYLEKSFWRLKYKVKDCKVIELEFQFKGLIEIPKAVQYLESLRKLILRYNQITTVPKWIKNLKQLEILNLNVNSLAGLPESIGSLSHLKVLSLWKNEIERLPDSFSNLNNLETLNLRLNQLKELPHDIGYLKSLKELDLHDNKLKALPSSVTQLSSLEKLNLSWNQLQSIPISINFLSNLKILDLERNELSYIPATIGELKSLENLNLRDNKLLKIPNTFGLLKNLKYLNLSRNMLDSIPDTLNSLSSLLELNLTDNQLQNAHSLKNLEEKGVIIYY